MTHEDYMRQALELARACLPDGDVPVGCVVVSPVGEVIGRGRNRREAEGCAAAEYTDGESVLFKELLLSPDKMGRGLAALERVLPGARCYVRTPALWDGMKGSYLQPFGMIKWYSAEKRALWGEGTHGYMGLGFD